MHLYNVLSVESAYIIWYNFYKICMSYTTRTGERFCKMIPAKSRAGGLR